MTTTPDLDVSRMLADRGVHIVLCCGAGGVGKTTTAAALGVRAAEAGRRVVVLTIDPARRLAQALGAAELGNEPVRVRGVDESAGGSLDAMMLDMKRTFDEVIETHVPPERAAEILANPVYRSVSTTLSGTQEYMAMEKLGQLRARAEEDRRAGRPAWDLFVVDTPPSRSALDFLDAPRRLGTFLDGRFIRLLAMPAKLGGRFGRKVFDVTTGSAAGIMGKLFGSAVLRDVQSFVTVLDDVFGGFRTRAEATYRALAGPESAFVVVSTPTREALHEALYFTERLDAEDLPLAGVVLNQVHRPDPGAAALDAATARAGAARLAAGDDPADRIAAQLLTDHAALADRAEQEHRAWRWFADRRPGTPTRAVPALAHDVHDVPGLREVAERLTGAATLGL